MANIPRSFLDALTQSLNLLSGATQEVARQQIEALEYADIGDLREKVIEILEPLLSAATDYAAAYSADTYDEVRTYSVGEPNGAVAHSGRVPEATEGAIRALVGDVDRLGFDAFVQSVLDRCDYEIKCAAGESTLYNAEHDDKKPRFARVPTGPETCTFCLMLASRGFVYRSEASAGALNHWHPHCDCRIIQGYPGDKVDGYDPDELYKQWKESGYNPKQPKDRNRSKFFYKSDQKGIPSFKNFDDVKRYLYDAKTQEELDKRSGIVGRLFGYPQSVKNVLKTAQKRLDAGLSKPDGNLVAGVKRGKPMDFKRADEGRGNPNFAKGGGYTINCQTCVVANELRRRGYNVEAKRNDESDVFKDLARHTNHAWIDRTTGKHPEYIKDDEALTPAKFHKFLESAVEPGKRYTLEWAWKGRGNSGHIITAERDENGELRLFDPQCGRIIQGKKEVRGYINRFKYYTTVYGYKIPLPPMLLQVDNLDINPDVVNQVLKGAET